MPIGAKRKTGSTKELEEWLRRMAQQGTTLRPPTRRGGGPSADDRRQLAGAASRQQPANPAILPPPGGPRGGATGRPALPRPGDVAQELTPEQMAELERRLAARRREIQEGKRKRPTRDGSTSKVPSFARGGVMKGRTSAAKGRTTRGKTTSRSRSTSKGAGRGSRSKR